MPTDKRPTDLFDLQVNGFGGVDFQREPTLNQVRYACQRLHDEGMKRILATFITNQPNAIAQLLTTFERYRATDELIEQTVVGYHLEGPYLSAVEGFRGAHSSELMKDPDWSEFQSFQDAANGNIRLVTLAPERDRAIEFIADATRNGVCISLGHTNASEKQIDESIAAGASLCTHLGNGCPAILPRHDNIIHRLLARDELTACLIPDGIHLPPDVLRNIYRAKPKGKVILTTDAVSAAGAGPGSYTLGHLDLQVGEDEIVRQPGTSYFAGSALRLNQGVLQAANWLGIDLSEAIQMASTVPAHALGFL